MNKVGRRYPLIASYLVCGIANVWGAFSHTSAMWLEITSFLIGKMAIAMSYTITTVHTGKSIASYNLF